MMSLSVLEEVANSVRKPMAVEPKPAVSDMPINWKVEKATALLGNLAVEYVDPCTEKSDTTA